MGKKEGHKQGSVNKFIYWMPRIASIAFILFLALFSLDVFGNDYGFWGTLVAFLMHNIPSFVLTAVLIIAWRYEIVGGIAFILAGLLYIGMLAMNPQFEWYMVSWSIMISGPAFAVGALFLVNWFRKKKKGNKR